MKLVSAQEMKSLDQQAMSQFGIPGIVLMENAGLRVVETIKEILGNSLTGRRILIFAGKGNNGGDGLVVARHLLNAGAEVKVFLLTRPQELTGDALTNFNILQAMQGRIYTVLEEKDLQRVDISLLYADLIVDAIYGTGFKGKATGLVARVIEMVSPVAKPVIAVDLPSGLEADTGKVNGPCVQATHTVTFCLPKLGLFLYPGARFAGRVKVVDIGIPRALWNRQDLRRQLLTEDWCRSRLEPREPTGHKGTYGHVLVVGGSPGMTGAVFMAAQSALKAGAGLVTAGVPVSLHPIMEEKTTEVMTVPLPETANRTLGKEALGPILELAARATVLAIGPGMSRYPEGYGLLKELLTQITVPVVIDADAINLLAGHDEIFTRRSVPMVITPHPGEMARLCDTSPQKIQENRLVVAAKTAEHWGITVVLKGAGTVVASPVGDLYINSTGNPGMATAGSGDVLTGIIAGLMAQGMDPTEAAAVGTYIHGAAGDMAAGVVGQRALVAGDLIGFLSKVLQRLEG